MDAEFAHADAEMARMGEALKNAHSVGDFAAAGAIASELKRRVLLQNPRVGMQEPLKLGQEGPMRSSQR